VARPSRRFLLLHFFFLFFPCRLLSYQKDPLLRYEDSRVEERYVASQASMH
jgi:hypothetical protein